MDAFAARCKPLFILREETGLGVETLHELSPSFGARTVLRVVCRLEVGEMPSLKNGGRAAALAPRAWFTLGYGQPFSVYCG